MKDQDLAGIMPTFRDLYPQYGAIGERYIEKELSKMYLRDCLLILYKLSRHYYKYCQKSFSGGDGQKIYRERCFELLHPNVIKILLETETQVEQGYKMIFPELSVVHLIKLCLKYCNNSDWTKEESFPKETLHGIGKLLLVTNSVLADWQIKRTGGKNSLEEIVTNFSKQIIVDHNFDEHQKLYQAYFIFKIILHEHSTELDIDTIFKEKYGVGVQDYFAFCFLLYSHFVIKNTSTEDWDLPHLDQTALKNVKPKFIQKLLEDLIMNSANYRKIDLSFFNAVDIVKTPLVRLPDGKIIPLSLRRLYIRLTESVYFDVLDHLDSRKKKTFSEVFGDAAEKYFRDIINHIDPKQISPFEYGKGKKQTPDAISVQSKEGIIFFECKKKQFHTLEFLQIGDWQMFLSRIKDFYFVPLQQICKRIKDFRHKEFNLPNVSNDVQVYPVVVCPIAPPIFSGAWDKLNLNQYVLPDYYKEDSSVKSPEFMDFAELESVEECLRVRPSMKFLDLVELKRSDNVHHNANWMVILMKNGFAFRNKRLFDKYVKETEGFADLLFDTADNRPRNLSILS